MLLSLLVQKKVTKEIHPMKPLRFQRSSLGRLKKSARNKLSRLRLAQTGIARLSDFSRAPSPAPDWPPFLRAKIRVLGRKPICFHVDEFIRHLNANIYGRY